MLLGTAISLISLALLVLAFALCAVAKRSDEESQIIERRLRDIARTASEHPGTVVRFERRVS